MRTSLWLLGLSVFGLFPSLFLPPYRDFLLLSVALVVASLILVLRDLVRRVAAAPSGGAHVVIDGSNVMHWRDEVPKLETLREVISALKDRGFQPGVIFDANAGYKFKDHYLDDRHFAKLLNLPQDRVLVVAKGNPADPVILAAARDLKAKVVTNDRYRDWAGEFPEVRTPGYLVRGGYQDGKLWLDDRALSEEAAKAAG